MERTITATITYTVDERECRGVTPYFTVEQIRDWLYRTATNTIHVQSMDVRWDGDKGVRVA